MTLKGVALKVAAISGDMPPIFLLQADVQLPVPHAKYHAWLVRDMLPSSILHGSTVWITRCMSN